MKNIYSLLLTVTITTLTLFAQTPHKMSYQAIIRDSGNQLVVNTEIGMQISILQGSVFGASVYIETLTPETNANGLVTIEIGSEDATVVTGDFSQINWSDGPYFIKTETDPSGGTDYTITGTSQLLSVPFALHSGTAEILTGEITESQISDLQNYLTEEADPLFEASPAAGIESADIANWDEAYSWGDHADEGYLTEETDPLFGVWDKSEGIVITESQIADLQEYLTEETDPSVPTGTQSGEIQYWDGTAWVIVAPGNEGQVLTIVDGAPTWVVIGATIGASTDVYNPQTGKIWMDRNLGASQVATSSTDAEAYGDLYQWGRGTDGHEKRSSGTISTLSDSDTPGHGDFILAPDSPWDWRSPQKENLWQGVNGVNNPCPAGYRLPTEAELEAELQSWSSNNAAGAFASPLKLPVAGYRGNSSGSLLNVGSDGYYWSGTVDGSLSRRLIFYSTSTSKYRSSRALGFSVRCLKD